MAADALRRGSMKRRSEAPAPKAYPDEEGILVYPYLLGAFGGARLLHIVPEHAWEGPACGAASSRPFRAVEHSTKPRPVCPESRRVAEASDL